MAPATEIALLPLVEGKDLSGFTSAAGQTLKECLVTISKQDGCQRIYWGRQVEDPSTGVLFVDWDSVDHHKKFIAWEGYQSFFDKLVTLLSGRPTLYHVHLGDHPPIPALLGDGTHVTEFLTMYFPAEYSVEDQKAFEQKVAEFVDVTKGNAEGFRATRAGWVVEELSDPTTSEKRKALVGLVGWDKVESHLNYMNTRALKDNVHLLTGAKDLKGVVNVHVVVKEFKQ